MDAIYVGIDVSKNRLDVAVRPTGESFAVARTATGIDELIERLSGGSSIRHRFDHLLRRLVSAQRPTRSMPW